MPNKTFLERIKKLTIRGAILGAAVGALNLYLTPSTKQEIEDQRIEALSETNKAYFKKINQGLEVTDHYATNQKGEETEIKELIRQSVKGEKAQDYAKGLAEGMYFLYRHQKHETLEQKIALAKETIASARGALQLTRNGGQGNYTLGYEYDQLKHSLLKDEGLEEEDYEQEIAGRQIDSVQTFDEFFGPKDGKEFLGDCDDFAMALMTIYHALEDYTQRNENEFYKALAEGLKHYKITSVDIIGHALNMGVTLKDKPEFEIIEPQNMNDKYQMILKNGRAFIRYTSPDGKQSDSIIMGLYNREFSAKAHKTDDGEKR